jgi:hypothetical protein
MVNSPVGDFVANLGFPAGAGDEAGPFKNLQMLGDVRLGDSETFFDLGDAAFVLPKPLKKPDSHRVSQSFKYFSALDISH